jgi:hypothetical protein
MFIPYVHVSSFLWGSLELCGDDVLSMLRSKFPTTRILLTDEEAG